MSITININLKHKWVKPFFSDIFRGYRDRVLAWKGLTVDKFSYLKWPTIFINEEFEKKVIDISPLLHCV